LPYYHFWRRSFEEFHTAERAKPNLRAYLGRAQRNQTAAYLTGTESNPIFCVTIANLKQSTTSRSFEGDSL